MTATTAGTATRPATRAATIFAFVLISLIWGSTWLVIKDQLGSVPTGWSVTWRFTVAALGMFVLGAVRRDSLRLSREGLGLAAVIGLFQFFINFQLVYNAEHFLTSGLVAVLFALLLVPNAIFARIFVGTPMGGRFILGTVVASGGIALLLLHEYRSAPVQGSVLEGIALTAAAVLSASVANVLQATTAAKRQPIVPLIAWAMLWGALGNGAYALVVHGPPVIDPRAGYLAGVAYLALIGTVVTFPLYSRLIRDMGPGKAAYTGVLIPIVAMALSTLFEGYVWSLLAAAGAVLAMAGLLIALSGRK